MTANNAPTVLVLLVFTAAMYTVAYALSRRVRHPLMHPIPVSAAVVIAVLHAKGMTFDSYKPVKDIAGWLLGPATVALAVPIHNQRDRLRALALPLLTGVIVGTLTTIAAALCLSSLGHL